MALQFKRNSSTQFQFAEVHQWIPQFGVSYALGVDGIALVLIALAAVLTPVCILAAWNDVPEVGRRQQNYFALMLVLRRSWSASSRPPTSSCSTSSSRRC